MGAAFGVIVSSMVGDAIMPIIGAVTGGLDFSNYYLPLSSAVKTGQPLADAKAPVTRSNCVGCGRRFWARLKS
jgi:large conductance mechanosensitive channel